MIVLQPKKNKNSLPPVLPTTKAGAMPVKFVTGRHLPTSLKRQRTRQTQNRIAILDRS